MKPSAVVLKNVVTQHQACGILLLEVIDSGEGVYMLGKGMHARERNQSRKLVARNAKRLRRRGIENNNRT